jgi:hypothetical protein
MPLHLTETFMHILSQNALPGHRVILRGARGKVSAGKALRERRKAAQTSPGGLYFAEFFAIFN